MARLEGGQGRKVSRDPPSACAQAWGKGGTLQGARLKVMAEEPFPVGSNGNQRQEF